VSGRIARIAALRAQLEGKYPTRPDGERTHCYCDAWGLTFPHYRAEHTQDHDDAQALRARRAEGGQE
jgi:hypothetical protein